MDSIARLQTAWQRLHDFFTREVWEARLETLPGPRARRYRALRLAYSVVDGLLVSDVLPMHAAALTYYTVLSIVPLLACAFSILKGFGAYEALVDETIRPYLTQTLSGNPALRRACDQVLDFVAATGVTSLGFMGLMFVLYAATRLLRNIELALNGIWGVRRSRSPGQQLKDYVTIIFVTPVCLLLAAGAATGQLLESLEALQMRLGLGGGLAWTARTLTPVVVLLVGLFALYRVMPNTPVRAGAAAVGALVGGLLWYVFLFMHVRFQVGVARYNALYSTFAAIPIFLVWSYASWLSVLVGAQVAAAHQQAEARARQLRWLGVSAACKQLLALSVLLRVARSFKGGCPSPSVKQLSDELCTPVSVVRTLLDALMTAHFVVLGGTDEDAPVVLARAPESIRVADVVLVFAGEMAPSADQPFSADPLARRVLDELQRGREESPHNVHIDALLAGDDAQPAARRYGTS
jgi:membrane protein